tara:strand:- start:15475 stop:18441 length:2967 start_codon:yes stop_codon:yes gene_type:complete
MRPGKKLLSLSCVSLFALMATGLSAMADPNPTLTSTSYFGEDGKEVTRDLILKSLNITVSVAGQSAETRVLAEFHNPTSEVLEGNFELEMPAGSQLIGYGLDINGEIRDGVIVEKKQAERAFNTRIRRGVDPGLAETDDANAFKTRVFPINPEQTRQISVTFVTPISEASPYRLPLESPTEPASTSITVKGDVDASSVSLPGKLTPNWSTDGHTGVLMAEDLPLDGVLEVSSISANNFNLSRHSNGRPFLSIDLPSSKAGQQSSDSIRVLWDASLSHEASSVQALEFMHKVIDRDRPYSLELIPFARGVIEDQRRDLRPQGEELEHFASQLTYDGATDLSAVFTHEADRSRADICYLVTDGRFTLGEFPAGTMPCTLHVVSASPTADDDMLAFLARRNGGQYVDLADIRDEDALERLSRTRLQPKRLMINGQNVLSDAEWADNGDRFRLMVPVAPDAKDFRLDLDGQTLSGPLDLRFAQRNDAAGAGWAQLRLTSMRAQGADRADLVDLSRRYSIVTDETSLLVLETLFDYVENSLPLPEDSFSKEEMSRYAELIEQEEMREQQEKDQRLERVLAYWKDQEDWYSGEWQKQAEAAGEAASEPIQQEAVHIGVENGRAPPPPPPRPFRRPDAQPEEESMTQDSIVVTGAMSEAPALNSNLNIAAETEAAGGTGGVLNIEEWSPDRPYLEAAMGKCGDELRAHYLTEREAHGSLPSYFLEMADLFHRCGQSEDASEILLTALELPTANDDTLTAVGFRLIRYGDTGTAIELFRKVLARDEARPQPWRNLALALADSASEPEMTVGEKKARLTEALELLNHIIANPWDVRFAGIDTISILEANHALQDLRELGGEGALPDEALEDEMPVDLRIVVNWNIDQTDMDLWVREPGGETAKFNNPNTAIGGRLSNDMTNGYGPEEYLLKDASAGVYEVVMDYYSSDIVNPNGAVAIQAEIWRDYGKPTESVRRVELEFTDDDQDEYLIATLKIGD